SRFEIGIPAVSFEGEPFRWDEAGKAPTPAPSPVAKPAPKASHAPGERAPTPKPTGSDTVRYTGTGERVQASVLNPPGAPVVITEAWVPRDPPPPSES